MKPFARELPVLELGEGSVVAGYRVGASVPQRSWDERVHEALSPKGKPATIVFARRGEEGRAGRTRFRRMARARARLEHPALIRIHDYGDLDSFRYLLSDPYPPRTFADQLDEGPVSPRSAIGLLAPVATALDLAHASGVVHQSLAAESLLRIGDHLVIDTFSLAGGGADPVFGISRGGAHPLYISPEAGRDEAVEPASNVYSLTAILVHALTGRPPFEGDPSSVVYAHLVEGPPRPSGRSEGLPEAIDPVVAAGMAKDPALRPRKAMALLQAASTALDVPFHPLQGQAARPATGQGASRRRVRPKPPGPGPLAWEGPPPPRTPGGSRGRGAPRVPAKGDRLRRGPSPRPPASKPRSPSRRPAPAGDSNGASAAPAKTSQPPPAQRPAEGPSTRARTVGAARTGAVTAWAAIVTAAAALSALASRATGSAAGAARRTAAGAGTAAKHWTPRPRPTRAVPPARRSAGTARARVKAGERKRAAAGRARPARAWALAIPVVAVGLLAGVLLASGGGPDETADRPDPVTARNVRAINSLEDQRLDLRAALADADSAPRQAEAAIALAGAYRSTAGDAPSRALAASAEEVAAAYEGLAGAARREDGGRFADASRAVDVAEEGFQSTAARVLGRP